MKTRYYTVLNSLISEIGNIPGCDRLRLRLEGSFDWDEYMAFRAQLQTTLWFKNRDMLKEIEPVLPPTHYREGRADILLSYREKDIFCEVTSGQSLQKSVESKLSMNAETTQKPRIRKFGMTEQDIEQEVKKNRILRLLLDKSHKQLPSDRPCILAFDGNKSATFCYKIQSIVKELFPQREHVILVMFWTLERGSQLPSATPFWFINRHSRFKEIGLGLLQYLQEESKIIDY